MFSLSFQKTNRPMQLSADQIDRYAALLVAKSWTTAESTEFLLLEDAGRRVEEATLRAAMAKARSLQTACVHVRRAG